jgi:hypothetical protein
MAATSKPYDHFAALCLQHSDFKATRIEIDFGQLIDYERVRELELWRIELRLR